MLDRFNNLYHSFDNMSAFSGALWTRTSNNCNELPSELLEPRGSEGVHVASSLIEYVDKEGRPQSECCVLFVESACVNPKTSEYRAFSKWKQKVSEAVRICRDLNIAGFKETFHDDLVLWVLNIMQNEPARYAQDLMQKIDVNADKNNFKFDGNIGLTTRFPSLPDASAAFCNNLSTREVSASENNNNDGPLTPNDRCIVQAMHELGATIVSPQSASTIIKVALNKGDEKRAFVRLKLYGYVDAKGGKNGGYWLTDKGVVLAEELQKRC